MGCHGEHELAEIPIQYSRDSVGSNLRRHWTSRHAWRMLGHASPARRPIGPAHIRRRICAILDADPFRRLCDWPTDIVGIDSGSIRNFGSTVRVWYLVCRSVVASVGERCTLRVEWQEWPVTSAGE